MFEKSTSSSGASGYIETRMVSWMRLVLASSALLIIFIDPAEPDRFVELTYATLVLYTIYSATVYLISRRQYRLSSFFESSAHWIDLCWYSLLIALSSGTNSLFFFGFLFSILAASFRFGFRTGSRVAVISAIAFTFIGLLSFPRSETFELNRFLLRPTYLLVLGYMIARRGDFELDLRRRLALLKDLNQISNPRFGIDQTITLILDRLVAFFQASDCVFVIDSPGAHGFTLYRAAAGPNEKAIQVLSSGQLQQFLSLTENLIVAYRGPTGGRLNRKPVHYAFDRALDHRTQEGQIECEKLGAIFDAESFISAPLNFHSQAIGRIFLLSPQPFDTSDAHFLLQIAEQVLPVIDHIRLVDQLASNAAEEERLRIARDIHDSIIQPYIGLQIGLAALEQKLEAEDPAALASVRKMVELTESGITDLRQYVSNLKGAGGQTGGLAAATRRFASRFSEVTGIEVRVETEGELRIGDRLAAEAFQMITEGLSNIRRHTRAKQAIVRLECCNDIFTLCIENITDSDLGVESFKPRSITERVEALGGRTHVEVNPSGLTAVIIEIPL